MKTKENNLPATVEESFGNGLPATETAGYNGELSNGPVNFRSRSKGTDNSGSIIGGVPAGGAVAIGAVAVTLILLGAAKKG